MGFELNGKVYETDDNGYLQNPDDWNKEAARYMAKVVGLELTSEHWEVIGILREYYHQYQYPPALKIIAKEMGHRLGSEKGSKGYFFQLFPGGQYRQAYKIAGVPMPFTDCGCERALIHWHLWDKTYEGTPAGKPSDTPTEPCWLQKDAGKYWHKFRTSDMDIASY